MHRILLVDDDSFVRTLLRMTLPEEDFEIVESADGEEALAALDGGPFDLVLLDWSMPGPSGGEVLAELRRRRPELPVIVLTAELHPRVRDEAESLGAAAFLTKPFSPIRLLGEVERLMPKPDSPAQR
jgi:CheY-like chemotaxis protein